MTMVDIGLGHLLVDWLDRIPAEDIARAPLIAAAAAGSAIMSDQPGQFRSRMLHIAEAGLPDTDPVLREPLRCLISLVHAGMPQRDVHNSVRAAHESATLAAREVPVLIAFAYSTLAYLQYQNGDDDQARTSCDTALRPPYGGGAEFARAVHAFLEADAGRLSQAQAEANQAMAASAKLGRVGAWPSGLSHHALAYALLASGENEQAEQRCIRAEELLRSHEPRLIHAHVLITLANTRLSRGKILLASTELAAAEAILRQHINVGLRVANYLRSTKRRLAEAQAGAPDERAVLPSAAELSVLRLLPSDLSQREIGDELFLSIDTVKTHTLNLYRKLGVNTRRDAVRRAGALGLV